MATHETTSASTAPIEHAHGSAEPYPQAPHAQRLKDLILEVAHELDSMGNLMHVSIAGQIPAPSVEAYEFLMLQRTLAARVKQFASVLMSVEANEEPGPLEEIIHGRELHAEAGHV